MPMKKGSLPRRQRVGRSIPFRSRSVLFHPVPFVRAVPCRGYHGRMPTTTRLITRDDVPVLIDLLRANRDFLALWEPLRTDEFFTEEHQESDVHQPLEQYEMRHELAHV